MPVIIRLSKILVDASPDWKVAHSTAETVGLWWPAVVVSATNFFDISRM
jgi:hypothetical protein